MTTREPRDIAIAADGSVNVAPIGTTLPTDATTALDAAFVDLGYINEDGVTMSPNTSTDGIAAWQSLAFVRTVISEQDLQLSFEMMQWNEETLKLAFGGGVYTAGVAPEWDFKLPTPDEVQEVACVVEALDPNGSIYRMVFERVQLESTGDIDFARTNNAGLPTTLRALAGTGGRAGTIYGSSASLAP